MASEARRAFDQNCDDVRRLLEIHQDLGGGGPGRRYGVEVLNKSAIVLVTAVWEAYCEDIAAEGLAHIVANCAVIDKLPKNLRRSVARELEADKNELAVWSLAGDGWRAVLTDRLEALRHQRNRSMNTPKSAQIGSLFSDTLGIQDITTSWAWPSMSAAQARTKLDRYVALRGEIAHRGSGLGAVRKRDVEDYFAHVRRLVSRTGGRVNRHAKAATGLKLF